MNETEHRRHGRVITACRQFAAVAGLTAAEAARQPICLLLAATCVLLIGLTPLLVMYKFGEDGKLVRDSALAYHLVFGLFIAGYSAASCLAREMKSGTASAILSKPVSRELLFLAKFFGVSVVVLLFSLCATGATLLSERVAEKFVFTGDLVGYVMDWRTGRLLLAAPFAALLTAALINYLGGRTFGSSAFALLLLFVLLAFFVSGFYDRTGGLASFDFRVQWRILPASCLVTMALIVLSAIALSLSSRLQAVPTLTLCASLLVLGLMSDYLFGRACDTSRLSAFIYAVLPNWQHFWACDALNGGRAIPWSYVLNVAVYGAAYSAGVLCLGALSFKHAEMK